MLDVALMIEGQDGLTWERWQRIAQIAEDNGFAGLFRSDHYANPNPPDKESLECWVSLTWLAGHTSRIEFGPLVSPMSFRHPAMLARMAAAVDDLSGGRLRLGLGAGWNEPEHSKFGVELLERGPRFVRYREGVEVISRLLHSDQPVSFEGQFYRLKDAVLLPRPKRRGGPPIVIGGNGPQRTLRMAARYAQEWNAVYQTPERFKELSARLDSLIHESGHQLAHVRRTMMTGIRFGRTPAEVEARLGGRPADELRQRGAIVGTPEQIRDQLAELEAAGVQRVMLQWLDLDDFEGMTALGKSVCSA
jgi:F420-dependent oxidoreductase-like protein